MNPNTLYYGDCLDWMREWPDECVDLIYLDPPFNSNADYNMLYSSAAGGAQYRAFNDTWYWDEGAEERYCLYESAPGRPAQSAVLGMYQIFGRSGMLAYLTYMAERLEQMSRLLRPTGSIYLHCDPTASHGLKLVMDSIFGRGNFRNEIVWERTTGRKAGHQYGRAHDVILFYARPGSTWNPPTVPQTERTVRGHDLMRDSDGLFRVSDFSGAGQGPPRRFGESTIAPPDGRHWMFDQAGVDRLMSEGRIAFSRTGRPRLKTYLKDLPGVSIRDIWTDPQPINAAAKERLGYPTQKPLALLDRIIQASSNPGDLILDPFCGCGTAIEAAHKLKRQWVGIDISSFAIDLIRKERMKGMRIPTKGIPQDAESARKMAREQPFAFESWAVTRLPGFAPNTKQVADGGVDGRGMLAEKPEDFDSRLALAQVKGGRFSLSAFRDFIHVTERDNAALGCFVTLDPVNTTAARSEAAKVGKIRVGGRDFRRMRLWPISDYFEGRLPPLPTMTDPYSGRAIPPSLFQALP